MAFQDTPLTCQPSFKKKNNNKIRINELMMQFEDKSTASQPQFIIDLKRI